MAATAPMDHQKPHTSPLLPIFPYLCTLVYTNKRIMASDTVIRLSVSEAARLFGVSNLTIRRALKAKELTYVVTQNRYKISFESLVKWSQRTVTVRNKTQTRGIGQFVDTWKIKNTLYSPNPKMFAEKRADTKTDDEQTAKHSQ